jgi:hypothetical protein
MAHTKLILKDAVENKATEAQIIDFEMRLSQSRKVREQLLNLFASSNMAVNIK